MGREDEPAVSPDWLAFVRQRLPPLALRPEREAEIAEEIALQLDQTYRAALVRGGSEPEARARAEADVADWPAMADDIRRAEHPLASRIPGRPPFPEPPTLGASRGAPMSDLWHDLRYAFRSLARSPGLSVVIVLTLMLGIGATTAIFSLVNGLLLKPLPFRDAERLVVVTEAQPGGGRMTVAWPNYQDWVARARSFDAMAAYRSARFNLTGGEKAERLEGRAVAGAFLSMLGVTPQLGRLITPADDAVGAPEVAVISDRLWRRRFGGDAGALGQSLMLSGRPHTVVGVLPAGFQYTRVADVFVALSPTLQRWEHDRGNHMGLFALAHLAPGVTVGEARQEMNALAAALAKEYPASNSGNGAEVNELRDFMVEDIRTAVLVLMAGVACVLLIGCVNLANLLLARGASRHGEVAVRVALGAGQGRIARQLLTESLLLAAIGGVAGIWFAYQALPLLRRWLPAGVPRLETVEMDGRVMLFALAVSLATGLAFGILPALQAARSGLSRAAGRPGGGLGRGGAVRASYRRALLVGEIGLAVVLLTAAGLMMRTVLELVRVDPGFRVERVVALSFELPRERYADDTLRTALGQITEKIEAQPGVEAAGLTLSLPFDGSNWGSVFVVADQPVPPRAELPSAAFTPVSPGLFDTLGMRLLKGRLFEDSDGANSPTVTVINETMAKRFWPGQDPLGKRIKQGWPESETPWREVVGVVADVKLEGVATDTPLQAYLPIAQSPAGFLYLVVRTAQQPAAAARMVEKTMRELDRDVPVFNVRTMEKVFEDSIATQRLPTIFLAQFSLAALVLAALGIFGLMAYSVAQRTHEMGLRMALGASDRAVVRQVLGEGLRVVAAGVALGVVGAFVVTRYLRSLLFEIQPTDPTAFVTAVGLLATVALLAAYLPARRAARVDPMVALRCE